MSKYWTKPRIVFAAWAGVELIGWTVTHFFQSPRVNGVWLVLTALALVPMFLYMPLRVPKLRKILLLWIISLSAGMIFSLLPFYVDSFGGLTAYLGVFWLLLMGITFLINALWWTPRLFIGGGFLQIVTGTAVLLIPAFLEYQYLVAAAAGTGGMLVLMLKEKPRDS